MDVDVDLDVCQGYGVCAQVAPTVFDLDDDGQALVIRSQVDVEDIAAAREAETSCPVRAIKLSAAVEI